MSESYFGTHLCKLTTVSGTVGGQLRQVSLYYYLLPFNMNTSKNFKGSDLVKEQATIP